MVSVTYVLKPQDLMLVANLAMFAVGGLAALIYVVLRPKHSRKGSEAEEPYLCGEPPTVVSGLSAPGTSLYWGLVKGAAKRLYRVIRDVMHSGRLSDWLGYMSGWYGFLVVVALISIIYIASLR